MAGLLFETGSSRIKRFLFPLIRKIRAEVGGRAPAPARNRGA